MDLKIRRTRGGDIVAQISRWGRNLGDMTTFWSDKFAPKFLQDVQDNWDSQGADVGGWPPLNPGYAAWKARRYGAHLGILELSLRLRGSLQWLGTDIGPDGIFRPGRNTLTIGTAVAYGAKHQRGTDGMQLRPFLFFRSQKEYERLWREWIRERAEDAGIGT